MYFLFEFVIYYDYKTIYDICNILYSEFVIYIYMKIECYCDFWIIRFMYIYNVLIYFNCKILKGIDKSVVGD